MKLFKTVDDKKMDVDVSEVAAYQETSQGVVVLTLKSGATLTTKNSFNSVRNSVKNGAAEEE